MQQIGDQIVDKLFFCLVAVSKSMNDNEQEHQLSFFFVFFKEFSDAKWNENGSDGTAAVQHNPDFVQLFAQREICTVQILI